MKGDGNFKWWCGDGAEPEMFRGPFDSREEAVEDGRSNDCERGFTICKADRSVLRLDIFDMEHLSEQIIDKNEECWGEDQDLDFKVSPEAAKQLEEGLTHFLATWWAVHNPIEPWSFFDVSEEEFFEHEDGPVECLACGKDCGGACDRRYDDRRAERDEG